MNKTEARYSEVLEGRRLAGEVEAWWFEEWKFRLKAKGLWWTPDFVVQLPDGTLEVHEVKGFMREDALMKLKLFRACYPIPVWIVRAGKGKTWDILPFRPDESEK